MRGLRPRHPSHVSRRTSHERLSSRAAQVERDWLGYDWEAFDGRLVTEPTFCDPHDIVILEGVYSARPELAEHLDLRVLIEVTAEIRHGRLLDREGADDRDAWLDRWMEAEDHYFSSVMPLSSFDLLL